MNRSQIRWAGRRTCRRSALLPAPSGGGRRAAGRWRCSAPAGRCSGLDRSPWPARVPGAAGPSLSRPRRRPRRDPRDRDRRRRGRGPCAGRGPPPGAGPAARGARVQDAIEAAGGLTAVGRPGRPQPGAAADRRAADRHRHPAAPGRRGAGQRRRRSRSTEPGAGADGSISTGPPRPSWSSCPASARSPRPASWPGGSSTAVHPGRGAAGGGRHRTEDLRPDRSACAGVRSTRPRPRNRADATGRAHRPGHRDAARSAAGPAGRGGLGRRLAAAPRAARAAGSPRRWRCGRAGGRARCAGRRGCWPSGW